MKKNILVPVDGSENALEALRTAIPMAKAFSDKIVVLNVQPKLETLHTKMFFSKEAIQEYQQSIAEKILEPAIEILKQAGCEFAAKTRLGNPKTEICGEARESDIKWIVMGSRGMGAVKAGILGSVSYGVLHEAPCPVMIVPQKF